VTFQGSRGRLGESNTLKGEEMTICVSIGGPTVYQSEALSNEILVGTTDGIVRLTRPSDGAAWSVADRVLAGKHVSSVSRDPSTGNLFAGTHRDGIYVSLDGGHLGRAR